MNDFERSLNLLDLVEAEQSTAYASVKTYNFFINYSGQRQPIEQIIDFVKDRVDISGLLSQSATAFLCETKCIVDPFIFMVASE